MRSHPSQAVRFIRSLPFGRSLAMRAWNRALWYISRKNVAGTYFGARMICDPRDIIQSTLTHFGVWEPEISEALEQLLVEGDLAVDMGANIGYYSLLMSKLVGPSGHVVAIEAMPSLAERVRLHASMNGATNVRVVNVAAAATRGRVTMYAAPSTNTGASTSIAEKGYEKAQEVDALPLTDILSADECKWLSLIKCDIEGAEVPVMDHLLDHLDRFSERLSIQVETSPGEDWVKLFERFMDAGFSAYQFPTDIHDCWHRLLNGCESEGWRRIRALPDNVSDILFTKASLQQ